jgi:tritrans,polycis-undecaprenyl-diphosphate synthase [geranylgeranyl-diphosphate specific]
VALKHVFVIPDGDRRYAKKVGISALDAYKRAKVVVRNIVQWLLVDYDLPELTFFGLSYANIKKRNELDLDPILRVQTEALNEFAEDDLFHDNEIRVCVWGEKHLLPKDYLEAVLNVESATKDYDKKCFNLLLGYSGSLDLTQAVSKLVSSGEKISFENIVSNCCVKKPIDFMVRTASEQRISDGPFFLTQYTEFGSVPTFFPELKKSDLDKVIEQYNNRKRTFGI